ncbi:class A beta-lactamase-related serine hydrolase [Natronospirillum operosum]|uniref:Class A beta-lactamase-related serine hydrolase n=1 Tax=Natronospirillum operosum TaxID=2759953 RepID=A0A4Z0WDM7_9GAMM|nr:serine hydrolase domain-containing protein [Natronospirillum operosum]TGG92859.1 class A beta-lactamase-related serine hydrolase [Natronospirillum operosum]
MTRFLALTGLLLAALNTAASSLQEQVDAYVAQSRQAQGIAVALLTPEELTRAVSGQAGPNGVVSEDTLFEIGSVTKVLTGLLLAQLSDDGVVSLDTTLGDLMPEPWALDPAVAAIRLQELATHTSGLPRLPNNPSMLWRQIARPADPYAGLSNEDIFAAVADLAAEDVSTRGEFAYSNLGPALLGRLLEVAAGEPYETLLEERVLAPLGLDQTTFTDRVLDDPGLARPHRENLRPARHWRLDAYNPAGGLSADLEDMITLLQAAMAAEPGSPLAASMAMHWAAESGEQASGLGWAISERDGERMIWHNGRTGGYYAFIGVLPDSGRGLVMLSNTSHAGDGFAFSLLRGDDSPPAPERNWFLLGLTLVLVPLAPMMVFGLRSQARATLEGAAKKPVDRFHFAGTMIETTFVLALIWKLGVWNVVPLAYWWAGLIATLGLLVLALLLVPRLPWWQPASRSRFALRWAGVGFTMVLMLWALLLL